MELLDVLVAKINANNHFHIARYGDGEWKAMFGDSGKNTDGHYFNLPGLKEDLLKTVKEHKPYFYGMQGLAKKLYPDKIKTILDGLFIPWIDADLFHNASIKGTLKPFIKALRKKRLCFIGPRHFTIKHDLYHRFIFGRPNLFITVKNKNCYEDKILTLNNIKEEKENYDVLLFSAGFLSNVLIWELHEEFKNKWMIDVGSLFDPYCGVNSRTYHEKLSEETKRENFGC